MYIALYLFLSIFTKYCDNVPVGVGNGTTVINTTNSYTTFLYTPSDTISSHNISSYTTPSNTTSSHKISSYTTPPDTISSDKISSYTTSSYTTPPNYMALLNLTDFNMTTHLEWTHVQNICKNRNVICKVNLTKLCAVREVNKSYEFKDFQNACFLFFANLCDYPGKEFNIIEGSSCDLELTRRHYQPSGVDEGEGALSPGNTAWDRNTTQGLRSGISVSKYDVAFCPQRHRCAPLSCPDLYHPVCMILNRNLGNLTKFYTFVNHCEMDRFFCTHYKEFQVAPEVGYPTATMSFLDWSYCGAQRYLKFLFTTKAASSMGHYGWLTGDERYSNILEPWERKPGYG